MNGKPQKDIPKIAANKYYALEAGGVDNWDGYSYAMEELKENEEED